MTLLLRRSDLEPLVDAASAVAAVEAALRAVALGGASQPGPFTIPTGTDAAKYVVMAAAHAGPKLVASKLLADIPGNRERGLPVQRSLIVLSSSEDGSAVAVIDGRVPTRERTAATTAVATRELAPAGARRFGFIGAGGLAEPHLRAMLAVSPVETAVIWSRTPESRARFAEQATELGVAVEVVGHPREVVERSDVVTTLTPSREPVLEGAWLRAGQHVNLVGAPPRPDHREIDSDGIARATVFVDDLASSLAKSGDVAVPIAEGRIGETHLVATIGEVLVGAHPGRVSADELTVFNSVGLGIQDLAICAQYLEHALAGGFGTRFGFSD